MLLCRHGTGASSGCLSWCSCVLCMSLPNSQQVPSPCHHLSAACRSRVTQPYCRWTTPQLTDIRSCFICFPVLTRHQQQTTGAPLRSSCHHHAVRADTPPLCSHHQALSFLLLCRCTQQPAGAGQCSKILQPPCRWMDPQLTAITDCFTCLPVLTRRQLQCTGAALHSHPPQSCSAGGHTVSLPIPLKLPFLLLCRSNQQPSGAGQHCSPHGHGASGRAHLRPCRACS